MPAKADKLITRRLRAAQAAGEQDADNVGLVALDLDAIKKRGLLVDIDFQGAGLFTARASGSDVGIADNEARTFITRGTKPLMPPRDNKLRSIEQRARHWTETHSRDIAGFRPYRVILYTTVPTWREGWERLVDELETWKAETIRALPKIRAWVRAEFTKAAVESWRDLLDKRRGDAGKEGVVVDGQKFHDRDTFVSAVVNTALRQVPGAKEIEAGIRLTYRTAVISTGADFAAEMTRLARLQAQREQYEAKIAQARQTASLAEIAELEAKRASVIRLEAMKQAEMEAARAQLAEMERPLFQLIDQVRAQIAEKVNKLAESVAKNNYVQGKVGEMASGLLEFYEIMSGGMKDPDLEAKLARLQKAIGPQGAARNKGEKRDIAELTAAIEALQAELEQKAEDIMAANPSRFQFIEVDEDED